MAAPSHRGRLLVAGPLLDDPNFSRTVIVLVDHSSQGALGFVLNRPMEVAVATVAPGWERWACPPLVVFAGGPVAPESGVFLAEVPGPAPALRITPVVGTVGMIDAAADPDDVAAGVMRLRMFAGCASWGPGQLDGELDEGSWLVVDADPSDLLDAEPAELWRKVIRRQPGSVSILARAPDDMSLN